MKQKNEHSTTNVSPYLRKSPSEAKNSSRKKNEGRKFDLAQIKEVRDLIIKTSKYLSHLDQGPLHDKLPMLFYPKKFIEEK